MSTNVRRMPHSVNERNNGHRAAHVFEVLKGKPVNLGARSVARCCLSAWSHSHGPHLSPVNLRLALVTSIVICALIWPWSVHTC